MDKDQLDDAIGTLQSASVSLRNKAMDIISDGGSVAIAHQILSLVNDTDEKVKQIENIKKRLAEPKK